MNAKVIFEDGTELSGIVIGKSIEELYIKTPSGCISRCEVTAIIKLNIGTLEFPSKDKVKFTRKECLK